MRDHGDHPRTRTVWAALLTGTIAVDVLVVTAAHSFFSWVAR
ncbi:hypothetical protein Krad_1774 [Kineococcus radiotolerans SRS30216 = ATCC BAA-149]|uniref:Uncharacterized protein n=1 Tax=Kineococcus radiotolerans (strain ATCC BAA-149 / DSM 14245 / SRS30216) TaxID=266940 RepID=A6W8X1_KINRD|nr:hypothetical protein Krad_1774 [Kineococcus radiotolerans SRS30216 = ATCC BAA-149]